MLNKHANTHFRGIVTNAIIGGFLGAVAGYLIKIGILVIPGIRYIFTISPFNATISGAMLGILIGAVISILSAGIFAQNQAPGSNLTGNESKFQLREEELDISKSSVQTGKVTIHKEVVKEEKNITVPVTREELVIEKHILDRETSGEVIGGTETIRIPIREERIEVIKNPIALEDVKVYRRQFQDTERVEKNLKKETVHIKIRGDAKVTEEKNEKK